MDSRTEVLIAAVVTALSQASVTRPGGEVLNKPAGLDVHDQELSPIVRAPAVGVYPLEEKALRETPAPGFTERDLVIAVEMRAQAQGSMPPHRALDPVRTWVITAIYADEALKALIYKLPKEIGTRWENEERGRNAAHEFVEATVSVSLNYRTRYGDPTVAWP